MSAPAHSPAPWEIRSYDGSHARSVKAGNGRTIKFDVLSPDLRDDVRAEILADLSLIAAAPETIRELARIADLFEHALATPGYGQDANSAEEAASALADARAAIAKATGEAAS